MMIVMKDKTRLLLTKIGGTILVVGIIGFLGSVLMFEAGEGLSLMSLIWLIIPAVLIIAILIMLLRRLSTNVKKGLPIDDEMSRRVKERTGYLAFMVTIWFMIGFMFYNSFVEEWSLPIIPTRYIFIITMAFMLLVFGVIWLILSRRGIK
jgi:hypothetical protein